MYYSLQKTLNKHVCLLVVVGGGGGGAVGGKVKPEEFKLINIHLACSIHTFK